MNYSVGLVVLLVLLVYYNGTQPLLHPTAQQSLQNHGFFLFILYSVVIAGISIISIQTKSIVTFFYLLCIVSLAWLILGKTWVNTPM